MIKPSIGIGLTILGSKELLLKLLGPTAEYLGNEIKGFVEKCNINIDDIFIRAQKKLGNRIEEKGVVSPRILKRIWDEGRFCEDELVKEYFAGLLASSRCEDGKDDRSLPFLSLVRDLSIYELKTHYILYTVSRQLLSNEKTNLQDGEVKRNFSIYIPSDNYFKALDIAKEKDINRALAILNHTIDHLARYNLIESKYSLGTKEFLQEEYPSIPDEGFIFKPSAFGATLYLWVHGAPDVPPNVLLCKQAQFEVDASIRIPEGAILLRDN